MDTSILSLSERGQVTIPQKVREQIPAKHFICEVKGETIILKPLQTREEFLEELDAAEKDWEKHGGLTLSEMKKKYNIS